MFLFAWNYVTFWFYKRFLFGYVTNYNLFPEPLSPEEEMYYLERLEQEDENDKNILIEGNLRLVAHIAKKYIGANCDQEDIISIGTIGLIKGLNSYKIIIFKL